MPTIIPTEDAANLKHLIDERVHDSVETVPGVVFSAVNRTGEIFFHAAGTTGLTSTTSMSKDTVFWLASCTKLITSIACMQLVESGVLDLDDSTQLESLVPELKDIKVLQRMPDGTIDLVDKKKPITLRLLMSHTAGFGYVFEDSKLEQWSRPIGIDDFDANEILSTPLVNQPGEVFQYGTNMDWVGEIIERASGLSLDAYFQQNIFGPLAIKHMRFFPSDEMKRNLAHMHERLADGTLRERDHVFRRPLLARTSSEKDATFNSGGCGCFGRPDEFSQIIASILNDGVSPKTNQRILKTETVEAMFVNQIPDKPRYGNEFVAVAKPWLANPTPIFPVPDDHIDGWGLGFSLDLQDRETGRAKGAGSWEGLPNLMWFVDRRKGVGMIMATQVIPFGDRNIIKLNTEVEKTIYNSLGI